MNFDLVIHNASAVLPEGVKPMSLGIADGKIVEIAPDISGSSKEIIDASNLHIFPGLIDSHVHFNDPGRSDWEGIASGSSALAAGGGTCFFDMPLNSSPPTLDGPSFDLKLSAARAAARTDFALWGGLTPKNLDRLEELAERGVIGFKAFISGSGIDDFERADDLTLLEGMKIAARLHLPVAVHAESESLTRHLTEQTRRRGRTGVGDYLASRPIVAELDAIRRAILFAQETGCALHIVHVSSARGSMEVVEGKHLYSQIEGPVDVTCETCPHYLALTSDDVARLGPIAKCAPPLRDVRETEALWQQLLHGGIDLIASDHSPAPPALKQSDDFFNIWGGIAGIQSTLPILLSRTPRLPLELIARLTAGNVADRYRVKNKGRISIGMDADLTLVDVPARYELTRAMLLDRHKLSPYVGRTFQGQVRRTLVRGQTVFLDGKIVSQAIGRLIRPG